MAATVPTTEPARIVAGDSLRWTIAQPDYLPADGWVLKYRASNAAANFAIVSTAAGELHAVSVAASESADYAAGDYMLTAYVEGPDAQRVTLYSKPLTVAPNLAAEANTDARTTARQILDALKQLYRDHVASGRALTDSYSVAGRSFKFLSVADLLAQIRYWEIEAQREDAAAGLFKRRRTFVRF